MKQIFVWSVLFFGLSTQTVFAYMLPAGLNSGAVSYWKLDESSGNVTDSIGSNTLTNENGVTFVAGEKNNGASLTNALAQDFVITDSSQSGLNFAPGAPFSMSIFVKPTNGSADVYDKDFIAKTTANSSGVGYMLSMENGGRPFCRVGADLEAGRLGVGSAYNNHAYHADTEIDDGNWHQVVCTYDGTILSLYVDGALWADRNVGVLNDTSNQNFYLGFRSGAASNDYFDGLIDEVGVWNRPLSASEVSDLYTNIFSPSINTPPTASGVATPANEDTPTPITLTGSDAEGDALTFATTTSPAHGTLSVLLGSTTTYTPDANYNGTDSFQYVVSDGQATSSAATATITVSAVNDAPVLGTVADQRVALGNTVSFTASATDVDGDALTYSISNSSASTTATIDSTTGFFTWNTSGVAAGDYVFTVAVSDGVASVSTTTTITTYADVGTVGGIYTNGQLVSPGAAALHAAGATSTQDTLKLVALVSTTTTPVVIKEKTTVTVPPAPTATSPKATTITPANPKVTTAETINTQIVQTAQTNMPRAVLTDSTNQTNQLSAAAASGFKAPLWACGVGGVVLAGLGTWWWLGGLAL